MLSRSLLKSAALLAAALCLSACAGSSGNNAQQSAVPAAPAAAAAPATEAAPAAAPAAEVAEVENGDEVVCKKYTVTGSRIATRKVCKTRREWVADSRAIGDAMRAAERRGATAAPASSMGGG